MTHVLLLLVALIPSSICAASAYHLAATNQDGWGWFLIAAIVLGSVRVTGITS